MNNENKTNNNLNKNVFPISEVRNKSITIRHVCDQSIARCNKNMIADLIDNKRERQQSIELVNQPKFGKAKVLKK